MNFFIRKRKSGLLAVEHGYFVEKWSVIKFKDKEKRIQNRPYDILEAICERGINCLLNGGITEMWNIIIGDSADTYAEANAEIGVGDDDTAAAAAQDDLISVTAEWVAMDAGYPTVAAQTVTFSGTFIDGAGEYDWNECAVRNGAVAPILMNRVVAAKGTKAAGEEWVARLAITLS